jgi:alkyl sulfatase BDS1-like metallo-beta-lactamase superfamily hydrolase
MKYVSAVCLSVPIAILLFLTACEPSSPVSQSATASPESTADSDLFYRGGADDKVVTAANGAQVNEGYKKYISEGSMGKTEIHNVTDGVWTITGYSISNYTFIEGETGLIAFDSGTSAGMGKTALEMIQKKVNKPVSAIIYSHFHYTGGAQVYAASNPTQDIEVYGHPDIKNNMAGQGATFRTMQNRRIGIQLGVYLPHEGPDAAFGPAEPQFDDPELAALGYLPVTHEVEDGETVVVDGIEMTFYHAVADTEDSLIIDVPSKDLVLHNSASAGMLFSLYTLRGSDYRTPVPMIASLDKLRNLNRKYYVGVHDYPLTGNEAQEVFTAHRDAYSFIYNQSVRAMNRGKTPDEMAVEIRLPKHLDEHPALFPAYVDNEYNVRGQYRGVVGWFDEDISELHPPMRDELAASLIALSGGSDALVTAANKAFAEKKYNLAVKLYSIVIDGEPNNKTAKQGMADALRKMAYATRAGIQTRSFLLTNALHLEGKLDMNKPPAFLIFGAASTAEIMASPAGSSVKALEAQLDATEVADVEENIVVTFTDLDKSWTIHVRRGIVEVSQGSEPEAIATLELPREEWAKLAIGEETVKKSVSAGTSQIKGDDGMLYKVLGAFDNIET